MSKTAIVSPSVHVTSKAIVARNSSSMSQAATLFQSHGIMFDNHFNSVAYHLHAAIETPLALLRPQPSSSPTKPGRQNHLCSLWGHRMRRRLPAASGWPPPQNALRKQNARGPFRKPANRRW